MDLGLNGKTALVMGASRGLGAASARTLALEGAKVIAAGTKPEKYFTNDYIDAAYGNSIIAGK
ncbi:MAG: hypothetical protein B7X76_11260 [Azorhizobium sp. 39-67-5]|nr:MAG: hypothetical protein B7X76_11260 [Azorhizobium sp. 39-67-5]